jgi:hypothetical protein
MKSIICPSLAVLFVISFCVSVSGQGNLSVSAGAGIPELFNFGLQCRISQVKIGIGYGFFPSSGSGTDPYEEFYWGALNAYSADLYYHFGKTGKISGLRPWYARSGCVYTNEERNDWIKNALLITARIGRDLFFSKRTGISFDVGINMIHYVDDPTVPAYFSLFGLPGFGVKLFVRI